MLIIPMAAASKDRAPPPIYKLFENLHSSEVISTMEGKQTKFRILVFPWLAHGHIFPLLELAKHLSLSRRRFHVYFCSTSVNLVSIGANIRNRFPSIELVELQMPSWPQLPPEFHTTKNLPPDLWPTLLKAFQASSCSFSDIVDSLKPDLLIYDFFQPWAPKIALSRGIPSVYFAASGAAAHAFYYHLYTEGTSSTFPYPAICLRDDEITDLRIHSDIKDADDEFLFGNFTLSHDIILMKSCRGVEGKYIDYLSGSIKKQIVITGPLVSDTENVYDDGKLKEIMEWLGGKKEHSTVYMSFGSEYFLSKDEIGEMAKGLELCNANFLWVIRFPLEKKIMCVEEVLPEGFLDRVSHRGMVITGWAPQTKILGHRSIGGFVSHCGWSSTLESMYFGVPIIAMPMKSEQPANARLAVEVGVGVEVGKGGDGQYTGEEVAKAINKVIVKTMFCEGLRSRTKSVREEMNKSAEEEVMNEVAEELWRICIKNKHI